MTRAVAIAVVLVGIACKDEPPAPPPKPAPPKLIPLAGAGFHEVDKNSPCLVPTITELRKHPHWMIRIDEMAGFDDVDTPAMRRGVIEWEATGAKYRHDFTPGGRSAVSAEQVAALEKALSLSCEEQLHQASFVGPLWFEIAYGLESEAVMHLPRTSEIVLALAPVFEAVRANHVKTRLTLARTLVLTANGKEKLRDKADEAIPKAWKPRTIKIDLHPPSPIPDDVAVAVLDYAMGLPETLPIGPKSLIGTLTVDGKSRPVAISLDIASDRDIRNMQAEPFLTILRLAGANRYLSEYD